ncbi:MAG: hypothetical protein ACT4QA_06475 [Panacagrimonas sp.]
MANSSIFFDSDLGDPQRRERLFHGDLFIYSKSAATVTLIELARTLLEAAFAPHDPRQVHRVLTPEAVAAILAELKPRFIHHPECKRLIPQIVAERGVDLDRLYFDVPRMRSAYPSDFLSSGIAYAFHPHRDTWYSAPMCQLNWWMPIYPLHPDNAMGFYPRYFAEPVRNNSEIYNYYEWNEKNRASAAQHVRQDTREQPKPQMEIDKVTLRALPPPGGLIVFSGAQLHETVQNSSGIGRYSIDFRTVHLDDVMARRGASNVDSRCTGTTMRDYLRASDLQHLPEDVVKLYDDGTEVSAATLYFGDRLLHAEPQARA